MESEESQWDFRTGHGAIKNDNELNGLGGGEHGNAVAVRPTREQPWKGGQLQVRLGHRSSRMLETWLLRSGEGSRLEK